MPLIPILEGAGCIVTDWQGRPPLAGGDVVAAGSRELHQAALAALRLIPSVNRFVASCARRGARLRMRRSTPV